MASKSSASSDSSFQPAEKAPLGSNTGGPSERFIVNSRCFVGAYRKTYATVVKAHHIPVIESTIFGNILNFPDITSDRPMLEFILRRWKEDVDFEIGPQTISFTSQEVAVLLGLPLDGQAIFLEVKAESEVVRRYLEGKNVNRKHLEVVLKEISLREDEGSIHDFVKLLILYFFCCVLFTKTNNTCPKGLLALVDDLPGLSRYNWPDAVHRLIMDSLCSAARRLQNNVKRVGYVLGCTPLLPVWIYEHTGYRSPIPSRRGTFPRVQRWDTIKWVRRSRGVYKPKEAFKFTKCQRRLELSPQEKRLIGIRGVGAQRRTSRPEEEEGGYQQVLHAIGRLETVVSDLARDVGTIVRPRHDPSPMSSPRLTQRQRSSGRSSSQPFKKLKVSAQKNKDESVQDPEVRHFPADARKKRTPGKTTRIRSPYLLRPRFGRNSRVDKGVADGKKQQEFEAPSRPSKPVAESRRRVGEERDDKGWDWLGGIDLHNVIIQLCEENVVPLSTLPTAEERLPKTAEPVHTAAASGLPTAHPIHAVASVPTATEPPHAAAESVMSTTHPVYTIVEAVPLSTLPTAEERLPKTAEPVHTAAASSPPTAHPVHTIAEAIPEKAVRKATKLVVAKKGCKKDQKDFKYIGKGILSREDQALIERFLAGDDSLIRVPSKNIDITRKGMVDLLSHMAFVSGDIIDSFQHLLEEAEGQRCIYSTTFLHQCFEADFDPAIFLENVNEDGLKCAKYWFIPLFDYDHWHLLAVDLQESKYLHLSSIRNEKYNKGFGKACKFVGNYLSTKYSNLFSASAKPPTEWEIVHPERIPVQDQSNDCAIFLLAYEDYLQKGSALNFTQKEITKFRGELAARILREFYST